MPSLWYLPVSLLLPQQSRRSLCDTRELRCWVCLVHHAASCDSRVLQPGWSVTACWRPPPCIRTCTWQGCTSHARRSGRQHCGSASAADCPLRDKPYARRRVLRPISCRRRPPHQHSQTRMERQVHLPAAAAWFASGPAQPKSHAVHTRINTHDTHELRSRVPWPCRSALVLSLFLRRRLCRGGASAALRLLTRPAGATSAYVTAVAQHVDELKYRNACALGFTILVCT